VNHVPQIASRADYFSSLLALVLSSATAFATVVPKISLQTANLSLFARAAFAISKTGNEEFIFDLFF
jgi:hypothetical protein